MYWFALTTDGFLRQFHSPDNLTAYKTVLVPQDILSIKIGAEVDQKAPDGRSPQFMIKLIGRDSSWVLCADSVDDMLCVPWFLRSR